jgi:hypothetical protein
MKEKASFSQIYRTNMLVANTYAESKRHGVHTLALSFLSLVLLFLLYTCVLLVISLLFLLRLRLL